MTFITIAFSFLSIYSLLIQMTLVCILFSLHQLYHKQALLVISIQIVENTISWLVLLFFQTETEFKSPDLKTLREKLLKNAEKMNLEAQAKSKPKKKAVFEDRKYLTYNYVIETENKEVSSYYLQRSCSITWINSSVRMTRSVNKNRFSYWLPIQSS